MRTQCMSFMNTFPSAAPKENGVEPILSPTATQRMLNNRSNRSSCKSTLTREQTTTESCLAEARSRCCGRRSPNVTRPLLDLQQLADGGLDTRPYEGPRAHVFRLFLHPTDLFGARFGVVKCYHFATHERHLMPSRANCQMSHPWAWGES